MTADLLIIGGGPAGAAAAIEAARAGLQVTLLEGEPYPREQPGETLHPGVAPLLEQLGTDALDYPRFSGIWTAWGSPARFRSFGGDDCGAWQGYHVWRATFDKRLLDRARECGCTVLQPVRALKVLGDGTQVLTSAGVLEGCILIDASGRREWLARQKNLLSRFESPRLLVTYSYVHGGTHGLEPLLETDAIGWTWSARVRGDMTAWIRLNWSGTPSDKRWRPGHLSHLRDSRPLRRADVTWRRREAPAGANYFCVGDAAAILDPTSSHGVLRAIMTGMMAAYLAARVLRQEISPEEASNEYIRWLGAWFEHDLRSLRDLHRTLGSSIAAARMSPMPA